MLHNMIASSEKCALFNLLHRVGLCKSVILVCYIQISEHKQATTSLMLLNEAAQMSIFKSSTLGRDVKKRDCFTLVFLTPCLLNASSSPFLLLR